MNDLNYFNDHMLNPQRVGQTSHIHKEDKLLEFNSLDIGFINKWIAHQNKYSQLIFSKLSFQLRSIVMPELQKNTKFKSN